MTTPLDPTERFPDQRVRDVTVPEEVDTRPAVLNLDDLDEPPLKTAFDNLWGEDGPYRLVHKRSVADLADYLDALGPDDREAAPGVAFLDLGLGDIDGKMMTSLPAVYLLRDHPATADVPIVLFSESLTTERDMTAVLCACANATNDPPDAEEVRALPWFNNRTADLRPVENYIMSCMKAHAGGDPAPEPGHGFTTIPPIRVKTGERLGVHYLDKVLTGTRWHLYFWQELDTNGGLVIEAYQRASERWTKEKPNTPVPVQTNAEFRSRSPFSRACATIKLDIPAGQLHTAGRKVWDCSDPGRQPNATTENHAGMEAITWVAGRYPILALEQLYDHLDRDTTGR